MNFTLIRNATVKLEYGDTCLLMDPYLAAKGESYSYGATGVRSPIVDLPMSAEAVLAGVDAVLLTHLHVDHFDETARKLVPRDMPLLCTPPHVAELRELGYTNIEVLDGETRWNSLTFLPTPAVHGPEFVLHYMGHVSGYLIRADGEPDVYFTSDTVLCEAVEEVIARERPDFIVTNSGGAFSKGLYGPIIMDAEQTARTAALAPWSTCIAIHLDTTDHGTVTRETLGKHVREHHPELVHRLIIPADGETCALSTQD